MDRDNPTCPAAAIADGIARISAAQDRAQEAAYVARANGDAEEHARLQRKADELESALAPLREAMPSVRAASCLGAMAQVAVMAAYGEWMDSTDDAQTRELLARDIERLAHSVVSFLGKNGDVNRGHGALEYLLPERLDYLGNRPA